MTLNYLLSMLRPTPCAQKSPVEIFEEYWASLEEPVGVKSPAHMDEATNEN